MKFAAALFSVLALCATSAKAAVIYVDFGHATTAAYSTGGNFANVRNGAGTTSNLVDTTNTPTAVSVAVTTGNAHGTTQGNVGAVGTDSYNLFNGFVNAVGVTPANNGTITVTFSGLNSASLYDFAIFGNRDLNTPLDNETFVLSSATGFTNISSAGTVINATTTSYDTLQNTTTGYVARWTNINPGVDGNFIVQITDVSAGAGVAYINAARLAVIPEPSTALLGGLGILALLRRRRP